MHTIGKHAMPQKFSNDEALSFEVAVESVLAWVRRKSNTAGFVPTLRTFLLYLLPPALISTTLDILVPDNTWVMYVRALLVIVMAVLFSLVLYLCVHHYVSVRRERDEDYEPLKQRMSLKSRRYMMAIIMALVVVLLLATVAHNNSGYSVVVALLMSCAVGSVAFALSTAQERRRMALGIPDPREKVYSDHMSRIQAQRTARVEEKLRKKKERQDKRNRYLGNTR